MNSDFFQFAFLFQLHKSSIPIGISDTDPVQLAAVYGVTPERVRLELDSVQRSNEAFAEKLQEMVCQIGDREHSPMRIAFLGDSNTSYRKSYMNIIRTAMRGRRSWEITDFSVSGSKSDNLLYALYPRIQDSHPQIAHIMIGTNDMRRIDDGSNLLTIPAETFDRNLKHIVEVLQGWGTEVLLTTIPVFSADKVAACDNSVRSFFLEEDRNTFNGIIRQTAEKYGLALNDMDSVYSAYSPEQLTQNDGLHLNDLGHELLSGQVMKHLTSLALEVV